MQSIDEHLKGWTSEYLGGDESLQYQLTNRQSGVVRESGGTEETIEPAPKKGAATAITDRRTLFLVGAAEDSRDDTVSIPHEEVAGVTVDEEHLADRLVLTTTAGVTWRFTAREYEIMGEAVEYIEQRAGGVDRASATLSKAREHRIAAEEADDLECAATQLDEAVAVYRQTVELATAPAVEPRFDPDRVREEIVSAISDAIDAHIKYARETRSRGNWEHGAGNTAAANKLFERSVEAFERAIELSRTCPPGDPAAVKEERDGVLTKIEDMEIDTPVAGDD